MEQTVTIQPKTPIRIESYRNGTFILSVETGDQFETWDIPGYVMAWNLVEPLTVLEDEIRTVEQWMRKKVWKGNCPCSDGWSAVAQGYGPWFFVDSPITAESHCAMSETAQWRFI